MNFYKRRISPLANMDLLPQRTQQGATNSQDIAYFRRVLRLGIDHSLTPRQREMVHMYFMQQLTMPQIATICCVNVSTVSRHIKAACKHLRDFRHTAELVDKLRPPGYPS